MAFITQSAYDKIVAQNKLKNIVNNKYLEDKSDPNFQYIRDKFFSNELNKEEKAMLFNVGSGLGFSIAHAIADRIGKPIIGVSVDVENIVIDLASIYFSTLAYKETSYAGSELELVVMDSENYWNDNGVHKILTKYVKEDNGQTYHYWLVKEYYIGFIITKLYKNNSDDPLTSKEVGFDELPATRNEVTKVETKIDSPSLYIIGDYFARDYTKSTKWIGKPTIISQALPTIYSCDRYAIMFDTQYLQHTEQWRIFKNVSPEITNAVGFSGMKTQFTTGDNRPSVNTNLSDPSKSGKNLITQDPQADVKIVNNENPMVKEAREHYKEKVQNLAATLSIPVEYLRGEIHQGQMGADSRLVLQEPFISLLKLYRDKIDKVLKEIIPILAKRNQKVSPDYVWEDVYILDRKEMLEKFKLEDEIRMSTKLRQIMEYWNVPETKAKEILAEILAEDRAVLDPTKKPDEQKPAGVGERSDEGEGNDPQDPPPTE